MKKNYFLVFILFVSFFLSISFAAQPIDPTLLSKKIDTILSDFAENINIGIFVQDAKTGKILYKKDVDRYFMPASSQKLFTAFAALQYLDPNFRYHTNLFIDNSKINKGILHDNIYIQFSGDPTLTLSQLDQLISTLSQVIRGINGKIIVDDTVFDQMVMSPGTSWEDQDFCWSSPVSALTINHNCVSATLVPGAKPEQSARLVLPDYPQSMQFINQVITSPATAKNCTIKIKRTDQTTYTISGCVKTSTAPQAIERAISSPHENAQFLLKYLFKKNQIATGKIEFKKIAISSIPFATHGSPPLKTLITTMLKESDNTIAEALFKTMGSIYAHEAGSFTNGNHAVREILIKSIQLNIPKTTLIDGAGGSRYNFLTPEQIVTLLQKIFLSTYASDFISSLAVSGVDGTLKDRMKDPLTLGKIHAKTGSETAVTSLSGYLETRKKQTLIFSIMINNFTDPASKYKALEDKICRVLVEAN